jgi:hypothetical protein
MCGSSCYSREATIDSGDLMAIIYPTESAATSASSQLFAGAKLHLSNRLPGPTQSTLMLNQPQLPSRCPSPALSICSTSTCASASSSSPPLPSGDEATPQSLMEVQIHEFNVASRVIHSFTAGNTSLTDGDRLDLTVGTPKGIVGRTVSVLDGMTKEVLGTGVVGWGR